MYLTKEESDQRRDNLTKEKTVRQKQRQSDKRRDNLTKEETIRQRKRQSDNFFGPSNHVHIKKTMYQAKEETI